MRRLGMKSNWAIPARRVRITLYLIALGGLLVTAAALITSGRANAAPAGDTSVAFSGYSGDRDQYSMWEDAQPFAPSVSATDAGGFGQRVCGLLNAGNSEGRLINVGATQFNVPVDAVRYLIHAAEWHYCPEFY
jgi:hypothetical protein